MSNAALAAANARRWADAKITRPADFEAVARRQCSHKDVYLDIARDTGVPWWFVAIVHIREANGNFTKQLGQGDPLSIRSIHVPKGRGPFKNFREGAYDALVRCAPYAARNTDWSIGGTLALFEDYNGEGYFHRGLPSPYVWSGTSVYHAGKYVRDGVFDPYAVDEQPGCAGILLAMMAIDPSIQFGVQHPAAPVVHATGKPVVPAHPESVPPSITHPTPGSIGAFIAWIFSVIFKRHS
jgi:lysozyme family protein